MQSFAPILPSFLFYDSIYLRGGCMEKKRKAITVRVDSQLKFQIEKCAAVEGYATVNSWIVNVIKGYLENKNVKK